MIGMKGDVYLGSLIGAMMIPGPRGYPDIPGFASVGGTGLGQVDKQAELSSFGVRQKTQRTEGSGGVTGPPLSSDGSL